MIKIDNKVILVFILIIIVFVSLNCLNKSHKHTEQFTERLENEKIIELDGISGANPTNIYLENDNKILKVNNEKIDRNLLQLIRVDQNNHYPLDEVNIGTNTDIKLVTFKKFPLNIIIYPENVEESVKSTYLAVFNDGALYKKNNITDTTWEGPLPNSYHYDLSSEGFIQFRSINLTDTGKLLGVGYNGKVYIKTHYKDPENTNSNNSSRTEPYKNKWRLWNLGSTNLLNILWNNDTNKYLGVDMKGDINVYEYDTSTKTLKLKKAIAKNVDKYHNISYDKDGYLLVINQDQELSRTKSKIKDIINNLQNFSIDSVSGRRINPNIIYDVIYDYDGKLYGIGKFNGNIRLLKQDFTFYLSEFKLPSKLENKNENILFSTADIVSYKSGFIGNITEEIPTLEQVYENEQNQDFQKFKVFCKNQTPTNYVNVNMLNKINDFQNKINRLKKIKDELLNLEEIDKRPIQ